MPKRKNNCIVTRSAKKKKKKIESDSEYEQETDTDIESELEYEQETDIESDSEYEQETDIEQETELNMEKLKKTDKEAWKNLIEVKKEILRTEPCINKILKAKILLKDKAKLCQYYEIYKSQSPNTEEWLEIRQTINKKNDEYKRNYIQYNKYTKEEHNKFNIDFDKYSTNNTELELKYKIINLTSSNEIKSYIFNKFEGYQTMEPNDDEYIKLKNWLTIATSLPYDRKKNLKTKNLKKLLIKVSDKMNNELYGMKKVKEQILVFIHAKLTNPNMKRCNLGLIGPPGVGKTRISRLIANILDIPFEQISLGGVNNPDFLKGHSYTYVGSQPGAITRALQKMGYNNGILYFDEYEKISDNKAICAALLHICDPEQQGEFTDTYLNIKQDLRYLWMIYSMNSLPSDTALADRIFPIYIDGYSFNDKVRIIQKHLLPKAIIDANLKPNCIVMDKKAASYIINNVCKQTDKGVRSIEKAVIDIINKLKFLIAYQDNKGNIPLFNISFKVGKLLTYPINVTNEILVSILEKKELSLVFNTMYL